jgi:hypothetical protein
MTEHVLPETRLDLPLLKTLATGTTGAFTRRRVFDIVRSWREGPRDNSSAVYPLCNPEGQSREGGCHILAGQRRCLEVLEPVHISEAFRLLHADLTPVSDVGFVTDAYDIRIRSTEMLEIVQPIREFFERLFACNIVNKDSPNGVPKIRF